MIQKVAQKPRDQNQELWKIISRQEWHWNLVKKLTFVWQDFRIVTIQLFILPQSPPFEQEYLYWLSSAYPLLYVRYRRLNISLAH
jgi:hypothetical protein